MAHQEEHLDDLGDLVGQTLNIFGSGDPYASLGTDAAPGAAGNSSGGGGADELDLLASRASAVAAAITPDPLTSGRQASLVEEDLLSHSSVAAGGSCGGAPSAPHVPPVVVPAVTTAAVSVSQHELQAADETSPSDTLAVGADMGTRASVGDALPSGGIRVTIREPEKVEAVSSLGLKTHFVTYTVRTDSTLPGLIAVGLEVKRRFSDFDQLHKHLKCEYRGYIIPPLPEKSFIAGKMAQDDFIRLRRADLQAFVKSVALHPVLRTTEAFKIFLLQPGDLSRNPAWTYLVSPPASLRQQRAGMAAPAYTSTVEDGSGGGAAAAAANTLKAGLGSWMTWMKASVNAVWVPPTRELSEEEVQLRQAKEMLQDLGKLLELAVESARQLCGHTEALSSDVRELGRTLAMMSRFEEAVHSKVGQYTDQGVSAAARATDLNRMAYGTAKQHTVWKTLSLKTAASLVTLHDYFVLIPEAVAALEVREAALATLQGLQDDLAAKQHAHESAALAANKLRAVPAGAPGGPSPAEKRAYQITTAISQLEDQIKAAKQEYDTLKQRNQSELARLHLEREVDFRRMLAHFARTQADLVAASAEMWASVARQYEAPTASTTEAPQETS